MGVKQRRHILWLSITAMDICHRGRAICAYVALVLTFVTLPKYNYLTSV